MEKKTFDKIQHSFMVKSLKKLEIKRTYFNTKKGYIQHIANIILNGEKLIPFPLM
jgi:hypothetical protein